VRKKTELHNLEERKRELELQGCTFKPQININTQILAEKYISNLSARH
jgi:hypothetical protein